MLQNEGLMQLLKYFVDSGGSLTSLVTSISDIQSDVNACFDEHEGFVKVIDVEHHAIHEGIEWQYDHLFTAVAQDGYARLHIYNNDGKQFHVQFFSDTESKAYVKSYIDTTYTNNGTLVTQWNRSTCPVEASVAMVYVSPTINVLGALRINSFTGSAGNPSSQAGGTSSSRVESIICTGHDILIEVQNKGSSAKDIAISARWYEVPGGPT
jgi:hypothetical protein